MPARVLTEAQRLRKKELDRRYYLANFEQGKIDRAAYQAAHRDQHRESNRKYHKAHRDKLRAKWLLQAKKNPRTEYHAEYRKKNREACAARVKAWAQINQPRRTASANRRRATMEAGDEQAKIVADFYVRVRAAARIACYWCGKNVPKSRRHIDHIVPLSKGGAHAVLNLCCACRTCNLKKRDKLPADFHPQLQMFV